MVIAINTKPTLKDAKGIIWQSCVLCTTVVFLWRRQNIMTPLVYVTTELFQLHTTIFSGICPMSLTLVMTLNCLILNISNVVLYLLTLSLIMHVLHNEKFTGRKLCRLLNLLVGCWKGVIKSFQLSLIVRGC